MPNTDYWIKTSFLGGLAIEVVMKRKNVQRPKVPKPDSDFYKRVKSGQSLKDHRYP